MATTVRLRDEDKATLNALQARYTLATGDRISLEELLSRVLELAEAYEDELILRDDPPQLGTEEIAAFHSGTSDWGVETREEDIDRIIYEDDDR